MTGKIWDQPRSAISIPEPKTDGHIEPSVFYSISKEVVIADPAAVQGYLMLPEL